LYFGAGTVSNKKPETLVIGEATKATGTCVSGNGTQESNVQVEFSFATGLTYSKLVLSLSLSAPEVQSGYWAVVKSSAELTSAKGVETMELKSEQITSLDHFSFSCNDQQFVGKTTDDVIVISLRRFQLQPFEGNVFAESFDCSPWFTLGMWMSLAFLFMFVSIITLGICFIVNVQTNDRFEDPRGKPLYIPNTD
jgi:hypothetical protein